MSINSSTVNEGGTTEPASSFLRCIEDGIAREYEGAVALRRAIHEAPDLSGHEQPTARRIFEYLEKAGMQPCYCIDGRAVRVETGNADGPTVVLRADIDALPIQEETGLAWQSRHKGIMHACGHDMHVAMCAGAARVLHAIKEKLQGRVVCIFQHAEEIARSGAWELIARGCIPHDTAAIFGMHVSIDHPVGYIGLHAGYDTTALVEFETELNGSYGHSSRKDHTGSALACAAELVQALHTEQGRAHERVSVGVFHSGTQSNVQPRRAHFSGTARAKSIPDVQQACEKIRRIAEDLASRYAVDASVSFSDVCPPVYNNEEVMDRVIPWLKKVMGKNRLVTRTHPAVFSEDFGFYTDRWPGLFAHIGVAPLDRDTMQASDIHTAVFSPEESAIEWGIRAHCAVACSYCWPEKSE